MPAGTIALSATEIAQLIALGPCLFIVLYLAWQLRARPKVSLVPLLYFLALGGSFFLPILTIFPSLETLWLRGLMLLSTQLLPELGFLLLLQLILRKPPPLPYWLVLALPLLGGGPLLYLTVTAEPEACFGEAFCLPMRQVITLYGALGGALVLLLLSLLASRLLLPLMRKRRREKTWQQFYWLIWCIIVHHVLLLALDIASLSEKWPSDDLAFTRTMLGMVFLYLVSAALFRVAGMSFVTPAAPAASKGLFARIQAYVEEEQAYLQPDCTRAHLADRFATTEQAISAAVNQATGGTLSQWINGLRVAHACERLREEPAQPIIEIAFASGFNSIAAFNRAFAKEVNASPSAYRKAHTSLLA